MYRNNLKQRISHNKPVPCNDMVACISTTISIAMCSLALSLARRFYVGSWENGEDARGAVKDSELSFQPQSHTVPRRMLMPLKSQIKRGEQSKACTECGKR